MAVSIIFSQTVRALDFERFYDNFVAHSCGSFGCCFLTLMFLVGKAENAEIDTAYLVGVMDLQKSNLFSSVSCYSVLSNPCPCMTIDLSLFISMHQWIQELVKMGYEPSLPTPINIAIQAIPAKNVHALIQELDLTVVNANKEVENESDQPENENQATLLLECLDSQQRSQHMSVVVWLLDDVWLAAKVLLLQRKLCHVTFD
ncbi:hypothetical protein R1sor_019779 [Riccia sorocarpa]|uniref:Uncharacterized protein n=1 Tax=Riccia sorocarpa TaxID=122646 RepID=A0ABD3IHU6_9MARC